MMRLLQIANVIGVLALAALCGVQWQTNRRVNLELIESDRIRLTQETKIADQEKTIQGCRADLDELRQRLTLSEAALKESQAQFTKTSVERDALKAERDALKTSLDQWQAAVAQRDAALRDAGDKLQKAIADRNDAIGKFNGLANKYDDLVKDWNKAQQKK